MADTFEVGDRVQIRDLQDIPEHLRNKTGVIKTIGGLGFAPDDLMVRLDGSNIQGFKVRDLIKID